ncbi:hypothetical protein ACEN2J_13975, partial [Pseudorhodobacter sp. W20_MBD10_FR17]|uniref:hypothetical protein n=1 Tax=Pseudorhodobacter sp. W20_MBD10_FR17 TaxID=3240266 RepID=UPI003F97940F
MQDIIEPILHQAAVCDLTMALKSTGLSIGDTAELRLGDDHRVAVYAHILRRRLFIRRSVLRHVGYLDAHAAMVLAPNLRNDEHLRVRIVGLTPEHLAHDGRAEMHVSVWGTARHASAPQIPRSSLPPDALGDSHISEPPSVGEGFEVLEPVAEG